MRSEEMLSREDNCCSCRSGPGKQAPSIGGMALPDATETDLIGWNAIEKPREQRDHQRA